MEINKILEGNELTITLVGRLDTNTAPQLEPVIKNELDGVKQLVFDMEKLDYISSAGLRVFIATDEAVRDKGGMILKNVNQFVYEILDDVGFTDFMKIEKA